MGASWDVFYSFLDRVLGTNSGNGSGNGSGSGSGNGSDKSGGDKSGGNVIVSSSKNENEKITDTQPPPDTLPLPLVPDTLLPDTLPLLLDKEKTIPITTLSSFYALVTHAYYRIEPFVHRVNFEFTEQQRKVIIIGRPNLT